MAQLAISDYLAAKKIFEAGLSVQDAQHILDTTKQPTTGYYYPSDINQAIEQLTYKKAV